MGDDRLLRAATGRSGRHFAIRQVQPRRQDVGFSFPIADASRASREGQPRGKAAGGLVQSEMHKPSMDGAVVYLNANPALEGALGKIEKSFIDTV